MSDITLQFPPGFEEYGWEVEAKGWLAAAIEEIVKTGRLDGLRPDK